MGFRLSLCNANHPVAEWPCYAAMYDKDMPYSYRYECVWIRYVNSREWSRGETCTQEIMLTVHCNERFK